MEHDIDDTKAILYLTNRIKEEINIMNDNYKRKVDNRKKDTSSTTTTSQPQQQLLISLSDDEINSISTKIVTKYAGGRLDILNNVNWRCDIDDRIRKEKVHLEQILSIIGVKDGIHNSMFKLLYHGLLEYRQFKRENPGKRYPHYDKRLTRLHFMDKAGLSGEQVNMLVKEQVLVQYHSLHYTINARYLETIVGQMYSTTVK